MLELIYRPKLSTLTTPDFLLVLFAAIKKIVPPALISKMAARNMLLTVLDKYIKWNRTLLVKHLMLFTWFNVLNVAKKTALMNIGDRLSTPPAIITPWSHGTLSLVIIRLIRCFLYHLKNYIPNVIQSERLVRHSSSTGETHWSLQVLTCNLISLFLISIILYELTSDTTRTLIGQKRQKPMFYCTGKLPLPDKAALRSTTPKDE